MIENHDENHFYTIFMILQWKHDQVLILRLLLSAYKDDSIFLFNLRKFSMSTGSTASWLQLRICRLEPNKELKNSGIEIPDHLPMTVCLRPETENNFSQR